MTTDQISPPNEGQATPSQPWGTRSPAPVGPRKRWSVLTIVVVAAVTIALAIGGGIAVSKLSSSSTTSAGGPGAAGMGGPGSVGGMGPGGGGAALGSALHGDFVASDGNGGYVTRRLQTGEVTAVSSSSISLKSADGFAGTYALTSSTTVASSLGDIQTADTVTVVATVSGNTATAISVSGAGQGAGQPGGQPAGQSGTN